MKLFNVTEPLGLPEGTVRGLITILFVLAVCTCWIMNVVVPETLKDITLIVVGYYFGSRLTAKSKETENGTN